MPALPTSILCPIIVTILWFALIPLPRTMQSVSYINRPVLCPEIIMKKNKKLSSILRKMRKKPSPQFAERVKNIRVLKNALPQKPLADERFCRTRSGNNLPG